MMRTTYQLTQQTQKKSQKENGDLTFNSKITTMTIQYTKTMHFSVTCTGETECGGGDGQVALTSIQTGNGVGVTDTITIGVLGTNILGMAIGAQVIGTGISGIIRGNTPMYMVQELVGQEMYMLAGTQIETALFILILIDLDTSQFQMAAHLIVAHFYPITTAAA